MTKSNKVLVPDHIAAEIEKDKVAETNKENTSEVDKALSALQIAF
jgi:hypothetical protein